MKNALGMEGEKLAQDYVKKLGYRLLEQNLHSRFGEVDIIAQDKDEIVFIEVKSRQNKQYGEPLESVTPSKVRKILVTAQLYLLKRGWESKPYRLDVISMYKKGDSFHIEHIKNIGF